MSSDKVPFGFLFRICYFTIILTLPDFILSTSLSLYSFMFINSDSIQNLSNESALSLTPLKYNGLKAYFRSSGNLSKDHHKLISFSKGSVPIFQPQLKTSLRDSLYEIKFIIYRHQIKSMVQISSHCKDAFCIPNSLWEDLS